MFEVARIRRCRGNYAMSPWTSARERSEARVHELLIYKPVACWPTVVPGEVGRELEILCG